MGYLLGKRPLLEAPTSFTSFLRLLLFDRLTLIRVLVIFRLQYHQYFYQCIFSRWLSTKAEDCVTYPWDMVIPCRMPPWIFQGDGDIIISIISIIIMFSLVLYHCTPPIFLRDHNVNEVTELLCIIPAISPYGNVFYQIHILTGLNLHLTYLSQS